MPSFHGAHFCGMNPGQTKHHGISTLKLEWILKIYWVQRLAYTWLTNISCSPEESSNIWFPVSVMGTEIKNESPFHFYTIVKRTVIPHIYSFTHLITHSVIHWLSKYLLRTTSGLFTWSHQALHNVTAIKIFLDGLTTYEELFTNIKPFNPHRNPVK